MWGIVYRLKIALPIVVGAWSMAVLLWQRFECIITIRHACSLATHIIVMLRGWFLVTPIATPTQIGVAVGVALL